MNDSSLRDSLLRHDARKTVDAELDKLKGLVKAEGRRRRWLALGIIAVWSLWSAMALAFVLSGTTEKAPELLAGAPRASMPTVAGPQMLVSGVIGTLLVVVGLLCLPAVVMVPLIIILLSRRSASMSQIRAGLASIEAQFKLLTHTGEAPAAGPSS
jgi:hypothetical protein